MAAEIPDQKKLEGTQYVAEIQSPGLPGQVTYYPSKPTPEFEKKMKRDRILGTTIVVLGFVFAILGFALAFDNRGTIIITILLVAVFSLILTIIFVVMGNVALVKVARTLPLIGYLALLIILVYAIITMLSLLSQLSTFDIDLIMSISFQMLPQFADFLMFIGLLIIRGGATLLWDVHRMRTDFSPSIIVMSAPGAQAYPQVPPQPYAAPQAPAAPAVPAIPSQPPPPSPAAKSIAEVPQANSTPPKPPKDIQGSSAVNSEKDSPKPSPPPAPPPPKGP
jgi:hypothetical protein